MLFASGLLSRAEIDARRVSHVNVILQFWCVCLLMLCLPTREHNCPLIARLLMFLPHSGIDQ